MAPSIDPHRLLEEIEHTSALDAPQGPLERAVYGAPEGLRDVLSGRWLGHPLHPVLTDLPIGFWTSSMLLDLAGRRAARASTVMVGLGVATAVPTAASGLVDWTALGPGKRRVGVVHLVANAAATATYALSFVARCRGQRGRGVALGLLGAGLATAGGFLGGHLAFGDDSVEAESEAKAEDHLQRAGEDQDPLPFRWPNERTHLG